MIWLGLAVSSGCSHHETAITKDEYLREGNAICSRGNEQIASLARQPAAGAPPDAAKVFADIFVPGIRTQLLQLRSLGYPNGDKAQLEAIFQHAEVILARAERDPSTIDGHAFDDVNRRLSAYGLRICGS